MSEWSVAGKTAIVTGANTGIGRVAAVELARAGAHVFLACRSKERAQSAIDEIAALPDAEPATFLPLDLASLDSVRACAELFLDLDQPLHLLINNAGLVAAPGLTKDGFEMAFGVNHMGHFLLTCLLMDRIKSSAPARVVNVASRSHCEATGINFDELRKPKKTMVGRQEYAVSKLANVLFTRELAKRLAGAGVTTYALHPGVVATDIWRRVPWPIRPLIKRFMRTVEEGAATILHCAMASELSETSGKYYRDGKEKTPADLALNDELAAELWRQSLEWTSAPDIAL